jgi:hypothetical protein
MPLPLFKKTEPRSEQFIRRNVESSEAAANCEPYQNNQGAVNHGSLALLTGYAVQVSVI